MVPVLRFRKPTGAAGRPCRQVWSRPQRQEAPATLLNYGEAPVDTDWSQWRGRVVGENSNPYTLLPGVAWDC